MDKFIELCSDESVDREESKQHIQSLLETGQLDPVKRDGNGWYPIHYTAKNGRSDIVQLLLSRRRCDPHIQTSSREKYTALHIASDHNQLEVVETLLEHCPNGTPAKRDGREIHHCTSHAKRDHWILSTD